MKLSLWCVLFVLGTIVLGLSFLGQAPSPLQEEISAPQDFPNPSPPKEPGQNREIHSRKGVYLPAPAAANTALLSEILTQSKKFGLNTVVVDIKNNNGEVCYSSQVPLAQAAGAVRPLLDLAALVAELHRHGLYVIARQVVFYDPVLAKYLGAGTAPWVLPTVATAVNYNLAIAKEVESFGVDEIQFDYIRFPDDGPIGPDYSGRCAEVERFVSKAQDALFVPISVDLFGRVMWPWNAQKIDPIGQHLEGIARYVDVISPMLYPSHFVEEELKADPYQTIMRTMNHGKARVKVPLRPYLQAFSMAIPAGMTLAEYIVAQVRAAEATGADGYLFWNPRADYTALWQALAILAREKRGS
ncbi:MAG: putative glycoside hydrolase [Candidatus Bipolaricaulota bacterium]|nr:putative glycoside hydrolase [Candidatus Bipolaricaulota bacterium]MDW8126682.1 putative glycoside hydrolase [Candidatus Bipolaricaulota bacterium]